MRFLYGECICLVFLLFIASCANHLFEEQLFLKPVSFDDLPYWNKDQSLLEALQSFANSCQAMTKKEPMDYIHESRIGGKIYQWNRLCYEALYFLENPQEKKARHFFSTRFKPHLVSNWHDKRGHFTGYYEPTIAIDKTKSDHYHYPIYTKPTKKALSLNRQAIDAGKIENYAEILFYAKDPVDLFFLHIQGSGRGIFPDGSMTRLRFVAKNKHPYFAIGRKLVQNGIIAREKLSALSIKNWMRDFPEKATLLRQKNQSYVFFEEEKKDAIFGAQNVPLTPHRSIAIDNKFIPYGVPLWVNIDKNRHPSYPSKRINKLMIAQDTGSAIKGVVRGDIFYGFGQTAEKEASYRNSQGSYYVFLPIGANP